MTYDDFSNASHPRRYVLYYNIDIGTPIIITVL